VALDRRTSRLERTGVNLDAIPHQKILVGIDTIVISVLIVVAIIFAPIVALNIQRKADEAREWKNRKLWIFKTLMLNRSTRLNPAFVQALNMIDIEFTAASEKGIQDASKKLLDHYNDWASWRGLCV
jgi:hypothetical protein